MLKQKIWYICEYRIYQHCVSMADPAIKEKEAKSRSLINSSSISPYEPIFRNSIQPRQVQVQVAENIQQDLFQQIKAKTGINIDEANMIAYFCKYFYLKMNGGMFLAMTIADAIKKKLGNNWIVFISNLKNGKSECNIHYKSIPLLKKKDFLCFIVENNLFQVCRY